MNRMKSFFVASTCCLLCIACLAGNGQGPRPLARPEFARFFTPEQLQTHTNAAIGLAEAFDSLAAEADAQWIECSAFWDWAAQKGDADQLRRVSSLKNRLQDEFAEAAADIAVHVLEWSRNPAQYSGPSVPEFWQAYRALAQKRDAFRQEIIALRAEFYTESGVNLRKPTTSNPFDFRRPKP